MFINEKMNMIFSVVNQSERTDRSGFYAQVFHKTLVGSKGQLSLPETLLKIMYVELAQMLKDQRFEDLNEARRVTARSFDVKKVEA